MLRNIFLAVMLFLLAACVSTEERNPYTAQIAQLDSDYRAGKIAAADYYAYRNKLSTQNGEWQASMERAAIRNSINEVLRETALCRIEAEKANLSGRNPAKIAGWLTMQMQQIDTTRCPADFRGAYQKHIDSVERYYEILSNRSVADDVGPLVIAFGQALSGDASGAYSAISSAAGQDRMRRDELNERLRYMGETWRDVRGVAIRYGANP